MPGSVKELHRLMRRVGKLTDGQASVKDIDWDGGSFENFTVVIQPNSGFYKGGIFDFQVRMTFFIYTNVVIRSIHELHFYKSIFLMHNHNREKNIVPCFSY